MRAIQGLASTLAGIALGAAQLSIANAAAAAPLRVAIPQEIANLTPYAPGVPEPLLELVYDKLAAPSPYLGNATPWLAQSITPDGDDGRSWRIALRDGIRWHDGRAFSAEDVAFTLRYYRDGPANRWTHHVSDTPKLGEIEATGTLSLRIRCEQPCPLFDKVTAADLPILPAHIWRDVKQPHRYQGPVIGTGPYRLAGFASGRYLRLAANDDYFAGKPLVDNIIVSFVRNPATAFSGLRAGEFDLVTAAVPPELVDALRDEPDVALLHGEMPLTAVEMRLNFERAPFSDAAFRRAIALAIAPEEILRRVMLNQGQPGSLGYPHPNSPWTAPGLPQAGSDPQAATEILQKLGYIDRDNDGWRDNAKGEPLRFSLKVSSSEPLHLRAAQVVARQLKAVGIDARVEAIDAARSRALFTNRQFDLMIAEIGAHGLADPDQLLQSHQSGYLWRAGLGFPKLDAAIADWQQATTPEGRIAAAYALQRLHSKAPTTLVLYYPQAWQAYRPRAYGGWRAEPGQGVFSKWSLLPQPVLVHSTLVRPAPATSTR